MFINENSMIEMTMRNSKTQSTKCVQICPLNLFIKFEHRVYGSNMEVKWTSPALITIESKSGNKYTTILSLE